MLKLSRLLACSLLTSLLLVAPATPPALANDSDAELDDVFGGFDDEPPQEASDDADSGDEDDVFGGFDDDLESAAVQARIG